MHSSRMRTARTATMGRGVWPGGGLCPGALTQGGVWPWGHLPGGCLPRGVSDRGGVCPGGSAGGCTMWPIPSCIWCYLYAASSPTETHQQCSCLYSGGARHDGIHTPPVNRITDTCKNITLSQLRLRAVTSKKESILFVNHESIKCPSFWIKA